MTTLDSSAKGVELLLEGHSPLSLDISKGQAPNAKKAVLKEYKGDGEALMKPASAESQACCGN